MDRRRPPGVRRPQYPTGDQDPEQEADRRTAGVPRLPLGRLGSQESIIDQTTTKGTP